ncbi:unnamed protein product, partial [Prorocentrum cordatum]
PCRPARAALQASALSCRRPPSAPPGSPPSACAPPGHARVRGHLRRAKLAALEASPSWRLLDVLAGTPAQGGAPGSRRRVFLGEMELRGGATLADLGATGGSELTLVVTPVHVLTASSDYTAKIWCAESGQCLRTLEGHDNY